jgi:hypothetical protein
VTGLGEFLQVGRIVSFGQFFLIAELARISFGNFFHSEIYVSLLKKTRLGDILGDFFTNSSGHPASDMGPRENSFILPPEARILFYLALCRSPF